MLEVSVNINRKVIVAQLHAVRTKPKSKTVKPGTNCTYNVVYNDVVVDTMYGKYGCGVDLAIALLEKFKENNQMYKVIAMIKLTEDAKNDDI